ncbi:MAG: glycosyltransferase [Tardiphaga sp.]|uniref:glycosyltransferase n=1 Tax=Tardiphaga sp. TaxID=1926292 RepID=UPI0019BF9A8B|nr:glycosyltransferase [Tardiphaga sp.]MBC7584822.1 glycosyltransferase [Tardiphaga sp.]
MVKRVLMIAFHFPPMRGSSGIQRTLKFARYLPQFGWQPAVLSAHPRAYAITGQDQMNEIAADMPVEHAFALDTSRHLAFKGKYLGALALPDRWSSWWLGAVPRGLKMIRNLRPDVLWSTYPIATAHLIGYTLHRLTGIPWIADFRDPMTDEGYPTDPTVRKTFHWIERKTLAHCALAVFSTPGTIRDHQVRFPDIPASRFVLIENGYDEENFAAAAADVQPAPVGDRPLLLVHSGIIYPSERDPGPFFEALGQLLRDGAVSAATLQIVLRATAHDSYLQPLIEKNGIGAIVSLAQPVPYRVALQEMLEADGLLILQAGNCNSQIPAKLYEYLRAQRPILGLTDEAGDTCASLRAAGIDTIAPLDAPVAIAQELVRFLGLLRSGAAPVASSDAVAACSRQGRTLELAKLLDRVKLVK